MISHSHKPPVASYIVAILGSTSENSHQKTSQFFPMKTADVFASTHEASTPVPPALEHLMAVLWWTSWSRWEPDRVVLTVAEFCWTWGVDMMEDHGNSHPSITNSLLWNLTSLNSFNKQASSSNWMGSQGKFHSNHLTHFPADSTTCHSHCWDMLGYTAYPQSIPID